MSNIQVQFPPNPDDGTIFEAIPGVLYKYHKSTNSWVQINQAQQSLATSTEDGYMSKEDFQKLAGILFLDNQVTLSSEKCNKTFNSGVLTLNSGDEYVTVKSTDSNIHENTAGIDFKVDAQKLIKDMIVNGQIKITPRRGDTGPQGDKGNDGQDSLACGPYGLDGEDGANVAWTGQLKEESLIPLDPRRVILDISTRKVSPTENYIVVTRGYAGDPEAVPSTTSPKEDYSPLAMAILRSNTICDGAQVAHLNLQVIVDQIHNQWVSYINTLKLSKESKARWWVELMKSFFETQKAQVCCALTACQSRTRNQDARRYLESAAMQAAMGGFKITVGGESDKVYPPMVDGTNTWNIPAANWNFCKISDPNCALGPIPPEGSDS